LSGAVNYSRLAKNTHEISVLLRHRIILTCEAKAQVVTMEAIIKKVFNAVPLPQNLAGDLPNKRFGG
jgi:hypothetical protein